MNTNNILSRILIWLPSFVITVFYIQIALNKILNINQSEKIINNGVILIAAGFFLLVAATLFLFNKTIMIGTFLLSSYMTCILFIHLFKGKPFEVTILIIMTTIFAAYLRQPKLIKLRTTDLT